jgi:hypothetical protein
MLPEIKILKLKLMPDDGRPLKALVDVQLGDLIIYAWRVIKQGNGRAQVSVPQVSWRDQGGRVRYQALLSIPGELKQRIDVAILSAWEREFEHGRMDQALPKTS